MWQAPTHLSRPCSDRTSPINHRRFDMIPATGFLSVYMVWAMFRWTLVSADNDLYICNAAHPPQVTNVSACQLLLCAVPQSHITPAQAVAIWPQLEAVAQQFGLRIGSASAVSCSGSGCLTNSPFDWCVMATHGLTPPTLRARSSACRNGRAGTSVA